MIIQQRADFLKFRRHFKLTQHDAAQIFGVAVRTVAYWEAGGRIPAYIGLAASAYAHNLKPWSVEYDR